MRKSKRNKRREINKNDKRNKSTKREKGGDNDQDLYLDLDLGQAHYHVPP